MEICSNVDYKKAVKA